MRLCLRSAARSLRNAHQPLLPPAAVSRRAQAGELGAQVFQHQPSILQTALPSLADRSLLRLMRDINYRYSNLCTVRGEAPPILVHAMSNAGFIAYGTMLHLASLLRNVHPPARSPAPGGTAASLEFDPSSWAAGGRAGGMTASRSAGSSSYGHAPGSKGGGVGASSSSRGSGSSSRDEFDGGELHRFVTDPSSLAVLSAFRQLLHNTQGIVLDSALLNAPAQEVGESHPHLLSLAHRMAERYLLQPQVQQRMREVRHAWQYSVPPCPQLYLYSRADALIPYQHIEKFMEQQSAHGAPVHSHCWDDTAHCEHLRKHPEQYRSLVRSFTEHCLHSHTPPESWI